MKRKPFVPAPIPAEKRVTTDKYSNAINITSFTSLDVHQIGHMVATPFQFFASFFERTDYCIQYIVKGKGDFFANNRLYKLTPNSLFLLPKQKYHYYTADKDDPYEYLWIHFSGAGFEQFLKLINLSEKNPVLFNVVNPGIEKTFHELIELSKNEDNTNKYLIVSKAYRLLHEILRACPTNTQQKTAKKNRVVDDIIEYLNSNYKENITLELLSTKFFLDKYYLVKLFKKETKLTPIQYLIQYRISMALSLLQTTTLAITAISEECGFCSHANFLLRFKKIIGISPSEYRKINRVTNK